MSTVTDKSGHLQCADLRFEDDAFCQKTEQVQDQTAGDGEMRARACSTPPFCCDTVDLNSLPVPIAHMTSL